MKLESTGRKNLEHYRKGEVDMIKRLAQCIREYKKVSILTPIFIVFEVILECIIPFIIANMVNEIQAGCGMISYSKTARCLY